MLRAAAASPDPCIIIEARRLYARTGLVTLGGDVEPLGGASLRHSGRDVGVITWGSVAPEVDAAAETLQSEGVSVAVLDLRWLCPLDDRAIDDLVLSTGGRILIVHEANRTGGFGAEVAARVSERHFDNLDSPVRRLATPDVRIPAAPALQRALTPNAASISTAIRSIARASRAATA